MCGLVVERAAVRRDREVYLCGRQEWASLVLCVGRDVCVCECLRVCAGDKLCVCWCVIAWCVCVCVWWWWVGWKRDERRKKGQTYSQQRYESRVYIKKSLFGFDMTCRERNHPEFLPACDPRLALFVVSGFCKPGMGLGRARDTKVMGAERKRRGTCWVASGWASSYISAMAELADGRKGGVGQSQILQTPTRTAQRGTMGNGEWGMGDGSLTTGCVGWGRGRGNGKRWWSQRRAHARTHARTNERNGGPSSGDRGTSQGGGRARAWAREREGEGRRRCVKHGSHGLHCLDRPGGAVRCGALRGAARVACYRREGERQETVGERLAGWLAVLQLLHGRPLPTRQDGIDYTPAGKSRASPGWAGRFAPSRLKAIAGAATGGALLVL